jgi:lipopolysaccharide assembly protein A
MRLVQFFQVIVLLALCAYLVLVALENPALVSLPLPLSYDEITLTVGGAATLFMLLGASYITLLLLPLLYKNHLQNRKERRLRIILEKRLAAVLQARLGAVTVSQDNHQEDLA